MHTQLRNHINLMENQLEYDEQMMETALAMSAKEWATFVRDVQQERKRIFEQRREEEADRLAKTMDMTPEGFVYEWDRHGRKIYRPIASVGSCL